MNAGGDVIIFAARDYIQKYGTRRNGPEIRAMMDLVSGVTNYSMRATSEQGYIFRRLLRDRITSNYIIDADSMIERFWMGVFAALTRVQTAGTTVMVQTVPAHTPDVIQKSGKSYQKRATQMSPLNYLRLSGLAYARRFIDESFKDRLRQQCLDCNRIGAIGTTREVVHACPKCGSTDSVIKAGFLRKRVRICNVCHASRPAKFERICGMPTIGDDLKPVIIDGKLQVTDGCGSTNVVLVQAEEFMPEDNEGNIIEPECDNEAMNPEWAFANQEVQRDVEDFIKAAESAMPRDPNDASGDSKNRHILRILCNPIEGNRVCQVCRSNAKQICKMKCKLADCPHDRTPDPKDCCGGPGFSINHCINYSRKIGEFMGFTTTLANRRVAKVREHTKKFALGHQRRYVTARYIAQRLG